MSDGAEPVAWRRVALQAATIVVVGAVAGLAYNVVAERGVFAEGGDEQIGVAEAKGLFDAGAAVFVDARFAWDFEAGHVPGALNVPVGQFGERTGELLAEVARDARIITYCTGQDCHSSHTLARLLKEEHGFTRVRVLAAGWPGWTAAGYPVEAGAR